MVTGFSFFEKEVTNKQGGKARMAPVVRDSAKILVWAPVQLDEDTEGEIQKQFIECICGLVYICVFPSSVKWEDLEAMNTPESRSWFLNTVL